MGAAAGPLETISTDSAPAGTLIPWSGSCPMTWPRGSSIVVVVEDLRRESRLLELGQGVALSHTHDLGHGHEGRRRHRRRAARHHDHDAGTRRNRRAERGRRRWRGHGTGLRSDRLRLGRLRLGSRKRILGLRDEAAGVCRICRRVRLPWASADRAGSSDACSGSSGATRTAGGSADGTGTSGSTGPAGSRPAREVWSHRSCGRLLSSRSPTRLRASHWHLFPSARRTQPLIGSVGQRAPSGRINPRERPAAGVPAHTNALTTDDRRRHDGISATSLARHYSHAVAVAALSAVLLSGCTKPADTGGASGSGSSGKKPAWSS